MRVFATGATGFVGAHTALALLEAGHQLCLLVRNERAARSWFESRGHASNAYVTCDIRDRVAIRDAMQGCDAAFHAAAAVTLDPSRAEEVYETNLGAAKAVLGAATELGLRRIVYVSSLTAILHPGAPGVDESTPLVDAKEPYSRSKRDADEFARGLQEQGHPVRISYPAAVIGPDDPKLSEANGGIRSFVTGLIPLTTTGFQFVDVRDLAKVHRWMLEDENAGSGTDGRYVVGGHYFPWADLRALFERVLGRRVLALPVPGSLMRAMGSLVDGVKSLVPWETPISAEAMSFVTRWPPADSSRVLSQSGLQFRAGEETVADTVRWMVAAGHIRPGRAGRLAG